MNLRLLSAAFFLFSAAASPAVDPLEVTMPEELSAAKGAAVINGGRNVQVLQGGALSARGEGNWILVRKGGAAMVTGNSNEIYVEAGGALTVTGTSNRIYMVVGATVTNSGGPENKVRAVPSLRLVKKAAPAPAAPANVPPPSAALPDKPAPAVPMQEQPSAEPSVTPPPEPAEAPAAGMFGGLGRLISVLPGADADTPVDADVPADPAEKLVGAWKLAGIDSSEKIIMEAAGVSVDGEIAFRKGGTGSVRMVLTVQGRQIRRAGPFLWEVADGKLFINKGKEGGSEWKRTADKKEQQSFRMDIQGGSWVDLQLKTLKD